MSPHIVINFFTIMLFIALAISIVLVLILITLSIIFFKKNKKIFIILTILSTFSSFLIILSIPWVFLINSWASADINSAQIAVNTSILPSMKIKTYNNLASCHSFQILNTYSNPDIEKNRKNSYAAIENYEKSYKIAPNKEAAWNLSFFYMIKGDYEKALKFSNSDSMTLSNSDSITLYTLMGDYKKALELADKERYQDHDIRKIDIYIAMKDYKKALDGINYNIDKGYKLCSFYRKRAYIYKEMGLDKLSKKDYGKSVEFCKSKISYDELETVTLEGFYKEKRKIYFGE